jgi:N6-L-threonylcarbamoyladenine synthase
VIFALETSCDDTCAALVSDDGTILANVISSQEVHDRFGGVVPEIAAPRRASPLRASCRLRRSITCTATSPPPISRRPGSSRRFWP